jgi:hypothetical protein
MADLARRNDRKGQTGRLIYASLLLVCLGSSLITALGRSQYSILFGRYAPIPLLFWVGLAGWITDYLSSRFSGRGLAVWCGMLVAASAATMPVHVSLGRYFERRERYQMAAALSITVGAPDVRQIRTELGTFLDRIEYVDREAAAVLGHSLFWRPSAADLGKPLAAHFRAVDRSWCAGVLDGAALLPDAAGNSASVLGWAWDYHDGGEAREILIVDDQGMVEGLGIPHVPRRDVGRAFSNSAMDYAGFLGYTRVSGPGRIHIFEELKDGVSACSIGVPRVPSPAAHY